SRIQRDQPRPGVADAAPVIGAAPSRIGGGSSNQNFDQENLGQLCPVTVTGADKGGSHADPAAWAPVILVAAHRAGGRRWPERGRRVTLSDQRGPALCFRWATGLARTGGGSHCREHRCRDRVNTRAARLVANAPRAAGQTRRLLSPISVARGPP